MHRCIITYIHKWSEYTHLKGGWSEKKPWGMPALIATVPEDWPLKNYTQGPIVRKNLIIFSLQFFSCDLYPHMFSNVQWFAIIFRICVDIVIIFEGVSNFTAHIVNPEYYPTSLMLSSTSYLLNISMKEPKSSPVINSIQCRSTKNCCWEIRLPVLLYQTFPSVMFIIQISDVSSMYLWTHWLHPIYFLYKISFLFYIN